MGTLNPASIFGLAAALLLFATVVGNPIRKLLLNPEIFEGRTASLAIRWVASVMTGLAIIPLVFLNVGLFRGLATPWLAWALLLVMLAWNLVLYRREIPHIPERLNGLLFRIDKVDGAFLLLFLGILVFELSPLWGLWTTPGDDAKLYSLITLRFVDTAGIPQTWGSFAPASWYVEKTHLLLPGFSSVAASLVYVTGVDIPTSVSVVTSVFRILPAATLFVLMFAMSRRKLPALLTMAVYGFFIVEPINGWFQWGGMAELSAISMLPLAVAGTFLIYTQSPLDRRFYVWLAVLMGGMSLLHPFAFFYFLAFIVPLTLVVLLRRHPRLALRMWTPVAGAILLAAAPILSAVGSEASIAASYSEYNPAWTPVASWSMNLPSVVSNVAWRVMTVYGAAVVFLLVLGIAVLRGTVRRDRQVFLVLGLWFAGMFFLHENNPNGLWLVPFPLWYRVDANRAFGVTSFIAASVAALVLEAVLLWLVPPLETYARPSARVRFRALVRNRKKAIVAGVLILMAVGQIYGNAALDVGARNLAPITADDMAAFAWIQTNLPASAIFFVNWADAGTWIPLYAQRTVVLPFGVVTNYALLNAYYEYSAAFAADPACGSCITFMRNLGATYVYAGPARIYGRPGFDPQAILATGFFTTLYHQGTVWIFQLKSGPGPLSLGTQSATASPRSRTSSEVATAAAPWLGVRSDLPAESLARTAYAPATRVAAIPEAAEASAGERAIPASSWSFPPVRASTG